MNLWRFLPRIKYNPPPAGVDDDFSRSYKELEVWFKVVGWCLVIGTLHYAFIKTNSLWFGGPEGALTAMLAWLAYEYFRRFTIILQKGKIVAFYHYGRPLHWPSIVAAFLVTYGARLLIVHWVDAVVVFQTK